MSLVHECINLLPHVLMETGCHFDCHSFAIVIKIAPARHDNCSKSAKSKYFLPVKRNLRTPIVKIMPL